MVALVHQDASYQLVPRNDTDAWAEHRCPASGGQPSVLGMVTWRQLCRWSSGQTLRLISNRAGALLSHPCSQHGCPQLSGLKFRWMLRFTRCIFRKSESIPCEWHLRDLKFKLRNTHFLTAVILGPEPWPSFTSDYLILCWLGYLARPHRVPDQKCHIQDCNSSLWLSYLVSLYSWCSANLFPQLLLGSKCRSNLVDRGNLWCSTGMFCICHQSEG